MKKGRPRGFDEDVALRKALELFWSHGYEGVSINMLCKEIGINVPSLYSAFGNKKDLFLGAAGLYEKEIDRILNEAFAKETPNEMIRSFLESQIKLVCGENKHRGCFLIQSALVTSPENYELSSYLSSIRLRLGEKIGRKLQEYKAKGMEIKGADPVTLAAQVMTLSSGLSVLAKSGFNRDKLNQTLDTSLEMMHAA